VFWSIIFSIPALLILLFFLYKFTIKIVPQGEVWIIERLGKYNRIAKPGFRIILFHPFYEKIRKRVIIKEQIIDVPNLEVITKDNVSVTINAVTFIKIMEPKLATYEIVDYQRGIVTQVKTAIRSIVGTMKLDEALSNRDKIKNILKEKIIEDAARWGIDIKSVEIVDLHPSESMQKAMEKQATAERERRALEIKANGEKQAKILKAEAELEVARMHAEAEKIMMDEIVHSIKELSKSAGEDLDGSAPMNFLLGKNYIKAMKELSKSDNSKVVVYPADIQKAIQGLFNINTKPNINQEGLSNVIKDVKKCK